MPVVFLPLVVSRNGQMSPGKGATIEFWPFPGRIQRCSDGSGLVGSHAGDCTLFLNLVLPTLVGEQWVHCGSQPNWRVVREREQGEGTMVRREGKTVSGQDSSRNSGRMSPALGTDPLVAFPPHVGSLHLCPLWGHKGIADLMLTALLLVWLQDKSHFCAHLKWFRKVAWFCNDHRKWWMFVRGTFSSQ